MFLVPENAVLFLMCFLGSEISIPYCRMAFLILLFCPAVHIMHAWVRVFGHCSTNHIR